MAIQHAIRAIKPFYCDTLLTCSIPEYFIHTRCIVVILIAEWASVEFSFLLVLLYSNTLYSWRKAARSGDPLDVPE